MSAGYAVDSVLGTAIHKVSENWFNIYWVTEVLIGYSEFGHGIIGRFVASRNDAYTRKKTFSLS